MSPKAKLHFRRVAWGHLISEVVGPWPDGVFGHFAWPYFAAFDNMDYFQFQLGKIDLHGGYVDLTR